MKLSSEQEALIPVFTKKWLNLAFSEISVDRDRVSKIINAAYELLGYSEPEILFYENIELIAQNVQLLLEEKIPNLNCPVGESVFKRIGNKLGKPLSGEFQSMYRQLCVEVDTEYFAFTQNSFGLDLGKKEEKFYQIYSYTTHFCAEKIKQHLDFQDYQLRFMSADKLKNKLQDKFFDNIFSNSFYTKDCLFIDYCHKVLHCNCNLILWNVFEQLCTDCGLMLIPFQSICLVCDRHELPINSTT